MANSETLRSDAQHGSIEVSNLSYAYKGLRVLNSLDLYVKPREFVVIVGPSGCGKTTLLNLLAGLLPLHDASVRLGGVVPRAGRQDVAYMFASDALLPWRTALGNTKFGAEVRGEKLQGTGRAKQLLAEVGLEKFERSYPRQLSLGMRQRVALARTFLMDSTYLLMDEPFGALDAHTRLALQELLLRMWDQTQRTVVFITHDLTEAILLADRILVFGARPARLVREVTVDLRRPRDSLALQGTAEFHALYRSIWADLEREL